MLQHMFVGGKGPFLKSDSKKNFEIMTEIALSYAHPKTHAVQRKCCINTLGGVRHKNPKSAQSA